MLENQTNALPQIEEIKREPAIRDLLLNQPDLQLVVLLTIQTFDFPNKEKEQIKGVSFIATNGIISSNEKRKGQNIIKYTIISDKYQTLFTQYSPQETVLIQTEVMSNNKIRVKNIISLKEAREFMQKNQITNVEQSNVGTTPPTDKKSGGGNK